jgi:hypothetical protein
MLDSSPGLTGFLGNILDDMQLFSVSSLMPQVRPHSPYEKQQRLVLSFPQSDVSLMFSAPWGQEGDYKAQLEVLIHG